MLMLTGVLFLGSCQEIDQVEPIVEESLDASFDRERFLNAVNIASLNLLMRTDHNRQFTGLNFRMQQSLEYELDRYINDLANNLNSDEYNLSFYQDEKDFEIGDEVYTATFDDIPQYIKSHLLDFSEKLDLIIQKYEKGELNEQQVIQLFKKTSYHEGITTLYGENLSNEEKRIISNIFFTTEELIDPSHELLLGFYNADNAFLRGKFVRALGRVALGIVIGAVIAIVPVLFVTLPKIIATKGIGFSTVYFKGSFGVANIYKTVFLKGLKVTKLYQSPYILYGFTGGLANAIKSYDKEWQSWDKEVVNSVKYKVKF